MGTRKLRMSFIGLFILIVSTMGYAQMDNAQLKNFDSKVVGEAMLRYQKGQIDATALSKVLQAKVVPSASVSEIEKTLASTQATVKTQSGKPLEEITKGSDLKLSGDFYKTAKRITDIDPSSFKNTDAYFTAVNKIIDDSSFDKNGVEYTILSSAVQSSKAYTDASKNNDLKITNPQTASNDQLTAQGWWDNWGRGVSKLLGGALTGGTSGASGGLWGVIAGAVGGLLSAASEVQFYAD